MMLDWFKRLFAPAPTDVVGREFHQRTVNVLMADCDRLIDERNEMRKRVHALEAALWDIIWMQTPKANATVGRMARRAEGAVAANIRNGHGEWVQAVAKIDPKFAEAYHGVIAEMNSNP